MKFEIKSRIYFLFLLIGIISCSKKKPMEELFYNGPKEYWQYYTGTYYGPCYIKFNKNNTSDYVGMENGKFVNRNSSPGIEGGPIKWSVSKDSILTWDKSKYDVLEYNDKIIILYNQGKQEPDGKFVSGFIYLVKGNIDNVRREPGYFGYKREVYPEKYREK